MNLRRLQHAAHSLLFRSPGTPGIGLVSGPVGFGKSTAAKSVCLVEDAVWLEAVPIWSPTWMLGDLAVELGAERAFGSRQNFQRVIAALKAAPRAVFIDEADRLTKRLELVEVLRTVHDQTSAPLILIGMHDFPRAVQRWPQLASRVAHWIEFQACDLRDVKLLAAELCEVEVADDLLRRLQEETQGSVRAVRIGLERLEQLARRRNKRRVALDDLPENFEFSYSLKRPNRAPAPESAGDAWPVKVTTDAAAA